jgi:peptidoglycan/LPS O-acetylase OafA/YrhL
MKKNKHFLFIQSLRGYVVLFVFLYHLNLDLRLNGFLGVDIFFLISGFVITKSIYGQSIINFNIKNFFPRRIKRLLPALIFIHEK